MGMAKVRPPIPKITKAATTVVARILEGSRSTTPVALHTDRMDDRMARILRTVLTRVTDGATVGSAINITHSCCGLLLALTLLYESVLSTGSDEL